MTLFCFERRKLIAMTGVWALLIEHSLVMTARFERSKYALTEEDSWFIMCVRLQKLFYW
jgi:hypothetical protein